MKKKVIIGVIVVVIALVAIMFNIGNKEEDNTIVMVTEAGFAPYEYYEGEKIVGVDVDVANEIAKALGKELVIRDVAFDSILNEIKFDRGDFAAAALTISPERAEEVDFSIVYTTEHQVMVVPKDSTISGLDDIHGKRMSIQTGSGPDLQISEQYDDVEMIRTSTVFASIEDLKSGKADFTIMDSVPAENFVKENPELKIVEDDAFEDISFGIAVKKGNKELLDKINPVLEKLKTEGKINEFIINHNK